MSGIVIVLVAVILSSYIGTAEYKVGKKSDKNEDNISINKKASLTEHYKFMARN